MTPSRPMPRSAAAAPGAILRCIEDPPYARARLLRIFTSVCRSAPPNSCSVAIMVKQCVLNCRRYAMRNLIVSNAVSLDGYYEGPGKNVMALFDFRWDYPTDESFDAYNAERLRAADTLLLGRVSYEGFKGFWPPVADDPNATSIQREI